MPPAAIVTVPVGPVMFPCTTTMPLFNAETRPVLVTVVWTLTTPAAPAMMVPPFVTGDCSNRSPPTASSRPRLLTAMPVEMTRLPPAASTVAPFSLVSANFAPTISP